MNYESAKAYCKDHGGSLATIYNPDAQFKAGVADGMTVWLGLEEGPEMTNGTG